jgi:hypothetical protein
MKIVGLKMALVLGLGALEVPILWPQTGSYNSSVFILRKTK